MKKPCKDCKKEPEYGRHFSMIQTSNVEIVPALMQIQADVAALLWQKYEIISYDGIQSGTPNGGCGPWPKTPC